MFEACLAVCFTSLLHTVEMSTHHDIGVFERRSSSEPTARAPADCRCRVKRHGDIHDISQLLHDIVPRTRQRAILVGCS